MRADDAQPVPAELLGPAPANEEGDIAASFGEPGAKVAAHRAGANNEDSHSHVEVSLFRCAGCEILRPVAQPRWLNVVTGQDIHDASGATKIGPSRRRIANRQQSMRLRNQNLARKVYGGNRLVRNLQFVFYQGLVEKQNHVRNL